ncbi:oxidoreductase [Lysobacter korlensis]|uniref:Oxidoreductase n=1 Tax=Lysobacter korlensis TaxID=553636 RepID=A0ABV6RR11_9GAMM
MHELSEPIAVALIGYGFAGRTFHAPLISAVGGLALTRVASSDAGKVHADLPAVDVVSDPMRAATDPDIGLVVIASPNDSHVPLARAALEAGKHVVVDKPFTPSLRDARQLAAPAERQQRVLAVFQNRRWDSDFLAIRYAIDNGLIGDVKHLESRLERFRPQVRERWRERSGPGSGLWWDLGPHLVDQALQLFGLPDTVQADLATQRDGATTDDWAHVVLGFGSVRAVLHAGMLSAIPAARFVVHGTRGSAIKQQPDPQEAQLISGMRPGDAEWGVDSDDLVLHDGVTHTRIPTPRGDQSRFYAHLCDALHGKGSNPVTPSEAVAVTAVLEAAVQSAAHGRTTSLELDDGERAAFERDRQRHRQHGR